MKYLCSLFLLLIVVQLQAFQLSSGLDKADRNSILDRIGFSSSTKFLSDPYPLGGYNGVELSLSIESISADELSELGDSTGSDGKLQYPVISFAKGIYNNIDLHAHMNPYGGSIGMSSYGLLVRWGVYESEKVPLSLSLVTHANFSNLNNQMTVKTTGVDIMTGLSLVDSSFYLGLGTLNADATFMGGTSGLNSSGKEESESATVLHSYFGYIKHFRPLFIALELNKYESNLFSAKVGTRF